MFAQVTVSNNDENSFVQTIPWLRPSQVNIQETIYKANCAMKKKQTKNYSIPTCNEKTFYRPPLQKMDSLILILAYVLKQ